MSMPRGHSFTGQWRFSGMEPRWGHSCLEVAEDLLPKRFSRNAPASTETILLCFGGQGYRRWYNDVIVFLIQVDGVGYQVERLDTTGDIPTPRHGHCVVLVQSYMYVYGGWGDGGVLRDVHRLDLATCVWTKVLAGVLSPAPELPPLVGHTLTPLRPRRSCGTEFEVVTLDFVVFGGPDLSHCGYPLAHAICGRQ